MMEVVLDFLIAIVSFFVVLFIVKYHFLPWPIMLVYWVLVFTRDHIQTL
mgnify:CR=1 FL=1